MPTKTATGVVPSDGGVTIFEKIITRIYADVFNALESDEIYKKAKQKQILNDLNNILDNAEADARAWVTTQIPAFYGEGVENGINDLIERGDEIKIYPNFAGVHEETIRSLASETYNDIAESMRGLRISGIRAIGQAVRLAGIEKIAKGYLTGDTNKKIADEVKKALEKKGIRAMIDRSGRAWSLENYTKMLTRTKLTQATNTGIINQALSRDNDLMRVSAHYGSCPLCMPFQFEVLSISGQDPNYISLEMAEEMGLFHPNCRHRLFIYNNRFENVKRVWDSEKQQFVDYNDLKGRDFNKEAFDSTVINNKELYNYSKNSIVGDNIWSSTKGMEKIFKGLPNYGKVPLPQEQIKNIVRDYTMKLKIDMGDYIKEGFDIEKYFNSVLEEGSFNTLGELQKAFKALTKSLRIPKNPINKTIEDLAKKAYYSNKFFSKIEKGYLFNKKGEVIFALAGDKSRVSIPSQYFKSMRDNILIHNHPQGESFSLQDLGIIQKTNLVEARIYGKDFIYILKRPKKGWGGNKKELEKNYNKIKENIYNEAMKKTKKGNPPTAISIYDNIINETSKAMGWNYSKIKK